MAPKKTKREYSVSRKNLEKAYQAYQLATAYFPQHQIARILGVSERTVTRLIQYGKVHSPKIDIQKLRAEAIAEACQLINEAHTEYRSHPPGNPLRDRWFRNLITAVKLKNNLLGLDKAGVETNIPTESQNDPDAVIAGFVNTLPGPLKNGLIAYIQQQAKLEPTA